MLLSLFNFSVSEPVALFRSPCEQVEEATTRSGSDVMALDSAAEKKQDFLESTIGSFGRWQLQIVVCMALLKFPIAWFQLGIIFLAPPTEHWCRQPEDFKVLTHDVWMERIAPIGNETNFHQALPNCYMRDVELPSNNNLVPCKWGYDYNRTIIHSSVITEWDLVCGSENLVAITQMVLMLGVLLGNAVFGVMADKRGRKRTIIACVLMQSVCGIISAWSPSFNTFLLFRFLMALGNGGTMVTSFIMCMEVVGSKWRSIVSVLYQIPFGIGTSVMSAMAFHFRDWRDLQLILSTVSVIFVIYLWLLPESPRWLLATGKRKEASKIIENAAFTNRLNITKVRSSFLLLQTPKPNEGPKFYEIFQTPELRRRTLLLCINWFLTGVTFFGFSQYLGRVGSNIYITVAVGGLIGIPGTLLCIVLLKYLGRRWSLASAAFFTATCFFGIMAIPKDFYFGEWIQVIIASFGIIGLSVSSPALYLLTGELYPTVLRNVGLGFTVMFCRIGSMISPFIIALHSWLPLTIFGILSILQAVLILPLPESTELLPETINDIEMLSMVTRDDLVNGNYLPVAKTDAEEH